VKKTHKMRDGSRVADTRLGRLVQFDDRSRNWPLLAGARQPPRSRNWAVAKHFDQGTEGMCVGTGCGHELVSQPAPVQGVTLAYCRRSIYWEAQKIDEWPGGMYPGAKPQYEGTSVLAGVKTLKAAGWCDSYRWAFGIDDLVIGLGYHGPAILGTAWYQGMMQTDKDGFVWPVGDVAGGHCYLAAQVNVKEGWIGCVQSWGKSWGLGGCFRITISTMQRLLAEDGEAVFLQGRHLRSATLPIPATTRLVSPPRR
jgi:hypothetical protein